jgi:ABC-type Zn uptake system ZnuABC Zn-binding protein ZnuA
MNKKLFQLAGMFCILALAGCERANNTQGTAGGEKLKIVSTTRNISDVNLRRIL